MSIRTARNSRRFIAAAAAVAIAASTFAVSNTPVSAVTPTSPSTDRIAGADRYDTAVGIARNTTSTLGDKGLIVASGESPYDALAASSLAGLTGAPIVLVRKDSVPSSVVDLISDNIANFNSSAQKVYIVGGTAAISQEVEDALTALVHTGKVLASNKVGIVRIAGTDRYDTAKKITEVAGLTLASDRMILVNGDNDRWADAISVSNIAAINKWPIATTSNGGLNATAKAAIDAYLLKPGSTKKFLIVGGPAVMPTSVEEYLLSKNVALADIDRRGGVDRYQTNLLLNLYALNVANLGGEGNTSLDGSDVALATGVSPWDALAAGPWAAVKGVHLVLTGPTALNPNAAGLAGALTLADLPTRLYMIGGTSALPNAIRSAFIATSQTSNMGAPTLTGCTPGSTSIRMTFPKKLSADENTELTATASKAFFSKNAVASTFLSGDIELVATNVSPAGDNLNTQYNINLSAPLAATNVIAFSGIPEAGSFKRSFAGASCAVAADTVAPTATIAPVLNANGTLNHILVTMSEPATTAAATLLSTPSNWGTAGGTKTFGVDPGEVTLSATAVGTTGTIFKVEHTSSTSGAPVTTSATEWSGIATTSGQSVVTLSASAIRDLASNPAAAEISGTAGTDTVAPTMSIAAVSCVATGQASFATQGISAVAKGTADGIAGNAWRLTVTQQRGLILPSVVVDNTAKTITVTMDTAYHTAADIKTVAANAGQNADWTFNGSGTFAATVTPAVPTGGESDCNATVVYSKPGSGAVAAARGGGLTVDGVTIANADVKADGSGSVETGTAAVVSFTTSRPGTLVLSGNIAGLSAPAAARTASSTVS